MVDVFTQPCTRTAVPCIMYRSPQMTDPTDPRSSMLLGSGTLVSIMGGPAPAHTRTHTHTHTLAVTLRGVAAKSGRGCRHVLQ